MLSHIIISLQTHISTLGQIKKAMTDNSDIGALAKKLCVKGYQPTVAHWRRFALLVSLFTYILLILQLTNTCIAAVLHERLGETSGQTREGVRDIILGFH